MVLQPVLPEENELVKYPHSELTPVIAEVSEIGSVIGLPCGFCDRYCKTIGPGKQSVVQVQVTPNGLEFKRWGGGELVWRCGRCAAFGRKITLKGMTVVPEKVPEYTADDVKKMVNDNVFQQVNSVKW
jgi:hypothetical protein